MTIKRVLIATAVLAIAAPALAEWDGIASGTITTIDTVAESNNYEPRVFLGGATMCKTKSASLNGWAYLNSSDPNYKGTLANLMLAFAAGKHVTIFSMDDSGVGCHIHYVSVTG